MPTLPANTVRAVVVTQTRNRVCHNVLYYEPDGGVINAQMHIQAVANAIDGHFRSSWLAVMSSQCQFKGVMAYYNAAGDVLFEAFSDGGPAEGTGGEDATGTLSLPDEVVLTIRKLTGRAGREDRGRLFVSGLPEGWNNSGVLNGDVYGIAADLGDLVPSDIVASGDGMDPVTLHARHWNRKDNVLRPIVGAMVNSVLESRRDRRNPLRSVPIGGALGGS